MEMQVYKVTMDVEFPDVDMDMCPCISDERVAHLFNSKEVAIEKAQSLFDGEKLGKYTLSVHVQVRQLVFDENGKDKWVKVLNLYKNIPHDIYGNLTKDN